MSVFTKIGSGILDFIKSNGLDSALKIAEIIPVTAGAATILEGIKNAAVGTSEAPNPQFAALQPAQQAKFLEMYKAESERIAAEAKVESDAELARLNDVANARAREIAIAQTPKKDWMMTTTGVIGLIAFMFIVWSAVYVNIPIANKDLFSLLMGNVMGVAITIFSYYYGSSKGSADKTKLLDKA